MCNAPFPIPLRKEHSKARRPGNRLTIFHSCKLIKTGNKNGIVAQHNRPSFADSIRIAGGRTKVFDDGLRSFRDDGAYGAEQNRVGRVEFYQCVSVIGAIGRRPPINEAICILCRACDGPRCH